MQLPARIEVAHGQQEQLRVAGAHDTRRAQGPVGRHLRRRHDAVGREIDAADGDAHVVPHQRGERGRGGGIGQQRGEGGRGERGRFEEGLGQPGPPRLLEDAHQVDVAQAEAVGGLGHHGRRRPELGQHGPAVLRQRSPAVLVGQFEGAQGVRGALGVEDRAHALAQLVLLLGEGEVHGPLPSQPRGSPSSRSATTLRWISLVPA